MIDYFKESMLKLTLEANPFRWAFKPVFNSGRGDRFEPNMKFFTSKWLFLTILVYIDNGVLLFKQEDAD